MVGLEEQEKGEGFLATDNSMTVENQNGKENAGHISSEDRNTVIEIEGEQGTEGGESGGRLMDGKGIRPGTLTRRRALVAGRRWKGTGGLCAIS